MAWSACWYSSLVVASQVGVAQVDMPVDGHRYKSSLWSEVRPYVQGLTVPITTSLKGLYLPQSTLQRRVSVAEVLANSESGIEYLRRDAADFILKRYVKLQC